MTLEERYMNMPRRRLDDRETTQRRPRDEWDEPPRRQGGARRSSKKKQVKRRRSPLAAVGIGLYKVLVVLSAVIVAAYIGLQLMSKPPEHGQMPPPVIDEGGGNVDTSQEEVTGLARRDGVYNVLLAATDKGGSRTDTMMVMSYDTVKQKVGVVSIPRDTITRRESGKNPKLVYGSGGVEQRVKDISRILGVPIDGYIKVDLTGFIALVDYLNGVDFYVPCDMNYDDPYQNLHIHYSEGQYHLNGQQAMEVARFRKNNDGSGYSDVGRTQTQQRLLVAMAKKVLSWGSLTKINGFVEIFNQYVDTDLSINEMLWFGQKALGLDTSTGVETSTLEGNGLSRYAGYKYCYELDEEKTLETVNRLINPYNRDLTLADMDLVRAESYHS